jgi:hypothetical protein
LPSNAQSTVDVPLGLFGGLDLELSPSDIPEGVSPANSECGFLPGSVFQRPAFQKVLTTPVSSLAFVYEKSFVTGTGDIKNLYFTGDGKLWVEDVSSSPGTASLLYSTAGASACSSITANYAEYLCFSDRVHGVDVPIYYDGSNLYRVTQDGPGTAPTVMSVALPGASLSNATSSGLAIDTAQPIDPYTIGGTTYYSYLYVQLTALTSAINLGELVTIAGNSVSAYNISGTVVSLGTDVEGTNFSIAYNRSTSGTGSGGTVGGPTAALARSNNTVTASTATSTSLKIGYQVQIAGASASVVGTSISSIVLVNEDNPGIATVTVATPHGLLPNNQVNIQGVAGVAVGGGIASISRSAQTVTVTTTSAHGLQQGSEVTIAGVADTTYNGTFSVLQAPSATTFTYYQFDSDSASTGGTVTYNWPLASANPATNYFTVQTVPTARTFTIALSYTDGTWAGGTVTFGWDGIFFVTAIISATQFQYQQYGPAAIYTTSGGATATPYGQASPGIHQCRVSFLLPNGLITAPSPPAQFIANGGQYLQVSGLPVDPAGIAVGRIVQFTGALGAYYFYLPVPAQVNGLIVSTATEIYDNTTTSILMDFSDNTLYSGLAVSIPGNNLQNQVVVGPAAGVFSYAERLMLWGERNKVQNLLNMGFDGGIVSPSALPSGWFGTPTGGSLVSARLGSVWSIACPNTGAVSGSIYQSAYANFQGNPIVQPNTAYALYLWLSSTSQTAATVFHASLTSASTLFSSSASISGVSMSAGGGFVTLAFSESIPATVPSDLVLTIWAASTVAATVSVDDSSLIFANQPFLDTQSRISNSANFGAFDGLTGILGAQDDASPVRNFGTIRKTLYLVTGTGLHSTSDNGQTEPSGWGVDDESDNCGAFSIASVARNPQGIGSAGKEWMMWNGPDGAQIFDGEHPYKISQEIQPLWEALAGFDTSFCWSKNDETNKRCYFGLPSAAGMYVAVLDYRNLGSAQAIANSPPIHISFTGKMIASDLTRKWTTWNRAAYCGELMYHSGSSAPQMTFGAGTNAYTLNSLKYRDDDFGYIAWSYTTFFFVSHEAEQTLQVGSHRKVYTLAQNFISGIGQYSVTPLAASLTNPFPASPALPLSLTPGFDVDYGINVETTRCAFTFSTVNPGAGIDAYAKLQKMVVNMAKAPWAPVRGSAGGSF